MSERGSALLDAMNDGEGAYFMAVQNGESQSGCAYEAMARAICEHLGLTWEMVDEIEGVYADRQYATLATLLEAAGVER